MPRIEVVGLIGQGALLWSVIGGIITLIAAALSKAYFPAYFKDREMKRRRIQILSMIRAELSNFGRHSGANLKRLVELIDSQNHDRNQTIQALKKFSSRNAFAGDDLIFQAVKTEDLMLLPQNLARDVMRMHLIARNIEIEIEFSVEMISEESEYEFTNLSFQLRLMTIGDLLSRATEDAEKIVTRIDSLHQNGAKDYVDDPIHFSDNQTYDEAAKWKIRRDAQQVVSREVALDLAKTALSKADVPSKDLKIGRHFRGTFNHVFEILCGARRFALRLRYREEHFGYEKGIFKECLLAVLQNRGTPVEFLDDLLLQSIDEILGKSGLMEELEWMGPKVFYFDFSNKYFNGPWALLEWNGNVNKSFGAEEAQQLGIIARQVHSLKFRRHYKSLIAPTESVGGAVEAWVSEIKDRIQSEPDLVEWAAVEESLSEIIDQIQSKDPSFVVCHNDLHCNNVVASDDGEITLIDWDNVVLGPWQLDFVKLFFWSKISPSTSRFESDMSVFSSFCSGYGVEPEDVLSDPLFHLSQLLWLLRIYQFESKREKDGISIEAPFCHPSEYVGLMQTLVQERFR